MKSFSALVMLAALSLGAAAQNLIANGDFESATFAPWVVSGGDGQTGADDWVLSTANPHAGVQSARSGSADGNNRDILTQTTAAVAGTCYEVAFFAFANGGAGSSTDSGFSASFGGQTLDVSLTDTYAQYSFAACGTNGASLVFSSFNQLNFNYLDDVSVTLSTACTTSCAVASTIPRARRLARRRSEHIQEMLRRRVA